MGRKHLFTGDELTRPHVVNKHESAPLVAAGILFVARQLWKPSRDIDSTALSDPRAIPRNKLGIPER